MVRLFLVLLVAVVSQNANAICHTDYQIRWVHKPVANRSVDVKASVCANNLKLCASLPSSMSTPNITGNRSVESITLRTDISSNALYSATGDTFQYKGPQDLVLKFEFTGWRVTSWTAISIGKIAEVKLPIKGSRTEPTKVELDSRGDLAGNTLEILPQIDCQ